MNLVIPVEKGLTGITLNYGDSRLIVTTHPAIAYWQPGPTTPLPKDLALIFNGPNHMNDAIAAAKSAGYIK